jgi:hypothetical protein
MQTRTQQLDALTWNSELNESRADVARIREEDETKQIYLCRSEDDDLDESDDDEAEGDDEAAEEEEDDESEEEDEVVRGARINGN